MFLKFSIIQTRSQMQLTNKFSFDKIKDIILQPLKDVNNMELLRETVSKDVSAEYGDFTFSAGGEAGIQIQLFNDVDDDNHDEVAAQLKIENEIKNNFAFLSYEILGKIKGGLKSDLDYATLGLKRSMRFLIKRTLGIQILQYWQMLLQETSVTVKLSLILRRSGSLRIMRSFCSVPKGYWILKPKYLLQTPSHPCLVEFPKY
jgi:hypothetical protein